MTRRYHQLFSKCTNTTVLTRCVWGSCPTRTYSLVSKEMRQVARAITSPIINTTCLTPSQVAYAHRLGMSDIDKELFNLGLSHPLLSNKDDSKREKESMDISKAKSQPFVDLCDTGYKVLVLLVKDYVKARFAKLPIDSHELAVKIYTNERNLSLIAKSTGIEYAIIKFTGVPNIVMPKFKEYYSSKGGDDQQLTGESKVYSDIFCALLGVLFREKGALAVRDFLDGILFTAVFKQDLLCRPKNPMLKLAKALRQLDRIEPTFRLLHESGRISNSSIYVVGVYTGTDKLAEAHGPSLLVAQERAAVEALKALFLIDTPNAPRQSDLLLLTSKEDPIKDFQRLTGLLK